MSSVSRIVDARQHAGGALRRVIGSTDARGQGTEFEIADLGPFVLVEDALGIQGPGQPTFGAHPHSGLVAVSHIVSGGDWRASSNVPGAEALMASAGDVVVTHAGRGIVHDERTAGDGRHDLMQLILRLPSSCAERAASVFRRPTRVLSDTTQVLLERDVLSFCDLDVTVYHCQIPPNSQTEIRFEEAHELGFLYVRRGGLHVAQAGLEAGQVGVLEQLPAALTLKAEGEEVECVIGAAAAVREPWVKLLGHNGFVVAPSVARAEAKLREYERDPQGFGQRY